MGKKLSLLVLIGWLISVNNGYANGFSQTMDVHIGMFDAANIKLDFSEENHNFNIKAEVETDNFFDTLYPFLGIYSSKGKFGKNGLKPEIYETYTKSRKNVRTKQILYNDKGKAYKRISTKNDKRNEVAIKNVPSHADSADLQSIFAELIGNFSKNRDCSLKREVYDGKKYYRVIAENKGFESRYFDFLKRTENAYKCSIYIENLKNNNDNILWDVSADKPISLWIGIDYKAKLPYVLEIKIDSTPLGELKVLPTSLKTN